MLAATWTRPALFWFVTLLFTTVSTAMGSQTEERRASQATRNLFSIDTQAMANGLQVIKHARTTSDTLTLHLTVNLGQVDFPCELQQTPHLVEHLLFEGTERFDAETLRKRIHDHGGSWHGFTTSEYTHFTLSVHSDYPHIAFENLSSMLREPLLNEANVARSVRIIESELRISRSLIKRQLNRDKPVIERGIARLYEGTPLACEQRSAPADVSLHQTKEAHMKHYNTSNMTLMVIGQYNDAEIDRLLQEHFSDLRQGSAIVRPPLPARKDAYEMLTERSQPLDSEVYIYLLIRGVGNSHPDSLPLSILSDYLDERLFYTIRTRHGLGYTPSARYMAGAEYGEIRAQTITHENWYKQTLQFFEDIYQEIRQNGIPKEDLERLINKRILAFESEERKHREVAQLYRHHLPRIVDTGGMPDLVAELSRIDSVRINATMQRYWPENPMIAVLRPPSSAENLLRVLLVIAASALLAFPIWRRIRRRSAQA